MIGKLTGVIAEKSPPQVLIDVQGVGYEVDVPMSTFFNLPGLGERASLLTNLSIREDCLRDRGNTGQGSTVAAVQRAGDGVVIAHVGDSRVYRFRGGALEPLTEDHSLVNEYIKFVPDLFGMELLNHSV